MQCLPAGERRRIPIQYIQYSTVLYILIFSKHYNVTTFPRLIQQFPQASGCPKCKAAFSLVEAGTVIP